jgi:hypothetical protein
METVMLKLDKFVYLPVRKEAVNRPFQFLFS